MHIHDILKRSIEAPDVSVKHTATNTILSYSSADGEGTMTFFPLFHGFSLAYIFIHSPVWPAPDFHEMNAQATGPLLFNYCIKGRCEMVLNNKHYVYVKDGELSFSEHFAQNTYQYPRCVYEGIEFFIEPSIVTSENSWLLQDLDIDFQQIAKHYCGNGNTYISPAPPKVSAILTTLRKLYDVRDDATVTQMKLYSLALFSCLQHLDDIPVDQSYTFLTKTQVDIAKEAEKIISSDLRHHHPARELANLFSISETSLKNYFRGVYGQNISAYLRELRLRKAAELLISTKRSVSDIAEQVGYMNQSKFSAVFKKYYGQTPLEYRRSMHLRKE